MISKQMTIIKFSFILFLIFTITPTTNSNYFAFEKTRSFTQRNLAVTQLAVIYPIKIYTNTSPINLDLTFNDVYTVNTVQTINIVNSRQNPTFRLPMTIGSITSGILRITSASSISNAGTYYFEIYTGPNSSGAFIDSPNVALQVPNAFLVTTISSTFACKSTDFSPTITFNQGLTSKQISTIKLVKDGLVYPLTINWAAWSAINNSNQLAVSGNIPYNGTYTLVVVLFWGWEYTTTMTFTIEREFSISSAVPNYVTPGCNTNIALVFNKPIYDSNITSRKFGDDAITNWSYSNGNTQMNMVKNPGTSNKGTYAIQVIDECNNKLFAPVSLIVQDAVTFDHVSISCINSGTYFKASHIFSSNLCSNMIQSINYRNTDTLTDNFLTLTAPNGSNIDAETTASGLTPGKYSIIALDNCTNTITYSADFYVKSVPTITNVSPTVFDTTNFTTTITLSASVSMDDVFSINFTSGGNTYSVPGSLYSGSSSTIKITLYTIAAGTYNLSISYWCNYAISRTNAITVVAVPTISSISELCQIYNGNVSFSAGGLIPAGLIASAALYNFSNGNLILNLTPGGISSNLQSFTSSTGLVYNGKISMKVVTQSGSIVTYGSFLKSKNSISISSVDKSIADVGLNLTVLVTFNSAYETNPMQIVAIQLVRSGDGATINQVGNLSNTSSNQITVNFGTPVAGNAGEWTVTAQDWCSTAISAGSTITITTIPSISSLSNPTCFLQSSAITSTITFSQTIYMAKSQIIKAIATAPDGTSNFDLVSNTSSSTSVTFNLYTGLYTIGQYTVSVKDFAEQVITTTSKFTIVETFNPTFTFTPIMWDTNISISIILTTTQNLALGQISAVNLYDASNNLTTTTISSQTKNKITLAAIAAGLPVGIYTVKVSDVCGNQITLAQTLSVTVVPTLNSFLSKCGLTTQVNTLSLTYAQQIKPGQIVSATAYDANNNAVGTTSLTSSGGYYVTTSINVRGDYTLKVTDIASQVITAGNVLHILETNLAINSYTPTLWETTVQMTVTITFNQNLANGQIISVVLLASDGVTSNSILLNSPNSNQITGTATISNPGTYTLRVLDWCDSLLISNTNLVVINRPVFVSMYPLCFDTGATISTVLTFQNNLTAGYFTNANLGATAMQMGTISTTNLPLSLGGGVANPSILTVFLTSVSSTWAASNNNKVVRIKTVSASPTISSLSSTSFDANLPITFTIKMNRVLETGEILSFSLTNTNTNVVTNGSVQSIINDSVVVTSSPVFKTGTYSVSIVDYCNNSITTNTNISLTISIASITPICYSSTSSMSSTITFNSPIQPAQIVGVKTINTGNTSSVTQIVGAYSGTSQQVTSVNGLPVGFYKISFTDHSSLSIDSDFTTNPIISVLTLTPVGISSVNPPVWDVNIQINLTLVFNRNLGTDELKAFSIKNTNTGAITTGTINSVTTTTASVTVQAISVAGAYDTILNDYCGNTITTSNALNIVVKPSVTAITPFCYLPNSALTSKVTFSSNLLTSQLISVAAVPSSGVNTQLILGSFTNNHQTITHATGIAAGYYTLLFVDSTNQSINSTAQMFVTTAFNPLIVFSASPQYLFLNVPLTLNITFTTSLFVGRLTALKLVSSKGVEYNLTLGAISNSDNKIITVTLPTGLTTYDDFTIVGTDICSNAIVSSFKVSTLQRYAITYFSPMCSPLNTSVSFSIDLDKTIQDSLVASVSITNGNVSYPLTISRPVTGFNIKAGSTGLANAGTYSLVLKDQNNYGVVAVRNFEVMQQIPSIVSFMPDSFNRGQPINLTITFSTIISSGYISSIVLQDSNNLLYSTSITNTNGYDVTISSSNITGNSSQLALRVNICNSQITFSKVIKIVDQAQANTTPVSTITCSIGSIINPSDNTQCVTCQSLSKVFRDGNCSDNCGAGYSIYMDSICTSNCSIYNMYSYNNICNVSCPYLYGPGYNGICILCRNVLQYYLNGSCVDACPSTGYTSNSNTFTCDPVVPTTPTNPSNSVNCNVNPCNGGVCGIQFNQIKCTCPNGKTGVYCEINSNIVNPSYMTSIVDQIVSSGSTTSSSQLAVVADNLLSNNANNVFTPDNSQKIYSFTTSQLNNLQSTTAPADTNSVLKLVNLAINFKSQELNNFGVKQASLRYLQGAPGPTAPVNNSTTTTSGKPITTALDLSAAIKNYLTQKEKIKADVLNLVNLTNSYIDDYINKTIFNSSSNIIFGNTYVTVQIGFNSNTSLADLSASSTANSLVDVDVSQCLNIIASNNDLSSKNSIIVTKIMYSNLMNSMLDRSDLSSGLIFYQARDLSFKRKFDIMAECNNVAFKYPITNSQKQRLNSDLYQRHKKAGIDIYDKNDFYFTSRCTSTGDLYPYDTTLDFRRQSIFQNITMSCNKGCEYSGIDSSFNNILCLCSDGSTDFMNLDVKTFNYGAAPDVNLDLFLCNTVGFSDQIYKNAGFWISLFGILYILLFVGLHFCLFPGVKNDNDRRKAALEYDDVMLTRYEAIVKTEKSREDEKDAKVDPADVKIGLGTNTNVEESNDFNIYRNSSFCEIYGDLLFKNHPVLTLGRNSILCPFGLKLSLFVFKSFMYFSWNAFMFTDSLMAKRINDSFRDNFAYPMAQEFGKIMASIVVTTILLEILRFITHQSYENLALLRENSKKSDDKIKEACDKNYNSMFCQYATAIVIMLIFSCFFFYFNTVFCGVYPKASVGWVYSGIWSLIFVWFAFSPFFLFLLTIIEYCAKTSVCCLGLKSVFNVIIRYMF